MNLEMKSMATTGCTTWSHGGHLSRGYTDDRCWMTSCARRSLGSHTIGDCFKLNILQAFDQTGRTEMRVVRNQDGQELTVPCPGSLPEPWDEPWLTVFSGAADLSSPPSSCSSDQSLGGPLGEGSRTMGLEALHDCPQVGTEGKQ
jgi:hypothetical protein